MRLLAGICLLLCLFVSAAAADIWYRDMDRDGWGDESDFIENPTEPPGYTAQPGDCDDTDPTVYPGATELIDGQDNDCDVWLHPDEKDLDGDGYIPGVIDIGGWDGPGPVPDEGDCDDEDATVYPGSPELIDGQDNDCDGSLHPDEKDLDGDGYIPGVIDIGGWDGPGPVPDEGDCDDEDSTVHPDAVETWYDGVDQDCDGWNDYDRDGDGYVSVDYPGTEGGTSPYPDDCDDMNPEIYPSIFYPDSDFDGWGTEPGELLCGDPGDGWSLNAMDCDDEDGTVYPGAPELLDGQVNDCDGALDPDEIDGDGDGYIPGVLDPGGWDGPGTVVGGDDCDDGEPTVYPGAPELCDDLLDNDCDGMINEECEIFEIVAAIDVPNDQGRWLRLSWSRPVDDIPGVGLDLTEYNVFRRIDGLMKVSGDGPVGAPPGDWDYVDEVPVCGDEVYHLVVPTLCDSTEAGLCWSVFFVRARTADPYVFIDSPPDSGYSVDNLAPGVPEGLTVDYEDGVDLAWLPVEDEDFRYYKIYRGDGPDFAVDPDNPVHVTTDAAWTDPDGGFANHYKVSAVDFAGNESAAASPASLTGIGAGPASLSFDLRQNAPNPFNPRTTIEFSLAEPTAVTLRVYDVSGSLVRTLLDGVMHDRGSHEVLWNGRDSAGGAAPAGVYFYRIEAAGWSLTKRMVLVK